MFARVVTRVSCCLLIAFALGADCATMPEAMPPPLDPAPEIPLVEAPPMVEPPPEAPAEVPPAPPPEPEPEPPADPPAPPGDPREGEPLPFLNEVQYATYVGFWSGYRQQISDWFQAERRRIIAQSAANGLGLSGGAMAAICRNRRTSAELQYDAVVEAFLDFVAVTGFAYTNRHADIVIAEANRWRDAQMAIANASGVCNPSPP